MDVAIKDRKVEVEYLRLALATARFSIDYPHADLLYRVQERLSIIKGGFSISEGLGIFYKWQSDWDDYFKERADKLEDVEPALLTDEWFLTHGFEVINEIGLPVGSTLYSHKKFPLPIYFNGSVASVRSFKGCEKRFVHEMQNLFYTLFGEFLEEQ